MSDAIPFFSDLRAAAIPAVQRLYDAAQIDGYSLPKLYSDLVSSLNKAGVTPPARKHVMQWLAAVKIGMAGRPEISAASPAPVSSLAPTPGYFENLPDAAIPALMQAWDTVQVDGPDTDDIIEKAFDVFFDAILAIGHLEPSWRGFAAYAKAVRAGEIERPARQIVEEVPDAVPSAVQPAAPTDAAEPKRRGRRVKADVLVVDPVNDSIVQPEIIVEMEPETRTIAASEVALDGDVSGEVETAASEVPRVPAFAALKSAAGQLLAEIILQLSANIEQTAREAAARMLREMADEMELGGA